MTAYDMPAAPAFVDCEFRLETNTQTFSSPLAKGQTKRQELDYPIWVATYTLPAMNKYQGAAWKAFFLKLKGRVHTINAYDPDCITPLGPAGGTPLVMGGSQTGNSLIIDGVTASVIFLKAGDYFSVNSELKCVTADATANGSGVVTVNFEPYLRSSPSDNAPITTNKPTCTMILVDDMQSGFMRDKHGIYMPKTFNAVEVF